MLTLFKPTFPQKLFPSYYITLYFNIILKSQRAAKNLSLRQVFISFAKTFCQFGGYVYFPNIFDVKSGFHFFFTCLFRKDLSQIIGYVLCNEFSFKSSLEFNVKKMNSIIFLYFTHKNYIGA